ncbi:gamma-taxilin-like protein [Lates japonicus]|uniref:Gamma-taxilin-like protein n=1 Tax=Lates japonicus TaxID=270547 RepID=A0AAD3RFZ4_LATJO|nr:gamma-taxilin-like protein [Lates japonicus]
METTEVCEIDVATRRIVGGSDSPPELDSPCQEEVAEFDLGLCCAEEERGETPGREDSPSDLGEAELDPGGDAKAGEDKAFGKEVVLLMQALNSLATPEEKLAALCKKYADLTSFRTREENVCGSAYIRKSTPDDFEDIGGVDGAAQPYNTKLRQEKELAEKPGVSRRSSERR